MSMYFLLNVLKKLKDISENSYCFPSAVPFCLDDIKQIVDGHYVKVFLISQIISGSFSLTVKIETGH